VFTAETGVEREDHVCAWDVALETGGWLAGGQIRVGFEAEAVRQAA